MCPGSLTARRPRVILPPMSHLTCTNCLQKSPVEATRCKHCGRDFGRPPARPGDRGSRRSWLPAIVLLAAAALVVVGAYTWWPGVTATPSAAAPEATAVSAPPPLAPKASPTAPAEGTPVVAPSAKRPPRDSAPRTADTARPVTDTARPVAPTRAPGPVNIDPAHQRYAQVFVKLRAEPSNTAAVLRVLQPGEVVTVDSLQDGWYRVVMDEQAVGYVDRQYLDTMPPARP